jgi:hypothetical protein
MVNLKASNNSNYKTMLPFLQYALFAHSLCNYLVYTSKRNRSSSHKKLKMIQINPKTLTKAVYSLFVFFRCLFIRVYHWSLWLLNLGYCPSIFLPFHKLRLMSMQSPTIIWFVLHASPTSHIQSPNQIPNQMSRLIVWHSLNKQFPHTVTIGLYRSSPFPENLAPIW